MESGKVVEACGWECADVTRASGGVCREKGLELYYGGLCSEM